MIYNLRFHPLTHRDEGNNTVSTHLFENVICVPLNEIVMEGSSFHKLSFAKSTKEVIVISDNGFFMFSIEFI